MSNPRIKVKRCGIKCHCPTPWLVSNDELIASRFPTHAEAIAYADLVARQA